MTIPLYLSSLSAKLTLIATPLQRSPAAPTKSSARAARNARLHVSNRMVSLSAGLQMSCLRLKWSVEET